jgi:NADPH:quinone reductase-like Zn-dependent oxidoreductase
VRTRYKVLNGILIVLAVGVVAAGMVVSHASPCGEAPPLTGDAPRMKAIVARCYGPPDVLKLAEVERPTPKDNELLVKVRAASVNPLDWHMMRGSPYIMRLDAGIGTPKDDRMGVDFAGVVEAVGKDVKQFKVGDEVFGGRDGAFAEYVRVREEGAVVLKPSNITFEQAAAVPIAGLTALQALSDEGHLQRGQKVLINGASGGVGTFAVQIAKSMGAEVTGVCSTRNVEMVKKLGADHVIDYTKENYTDAAVQYDLIVDTVGSQSLLANRRVLKPDGIFVIVGGPKGDWLGPLVSPIKAMAVSPFVKQKMGFFIAGMDQKDLNTLRGLMQSGAVTPVIDRAYPLNQTAEAVAYLEDGHARGKVVITME